MAQQRLAGCQLCGYSTVVTIGGNRSNYKTNDPFPAFCYHCDDLSRVNRALDDDVCMKCGSTKISRYGDKTRGKLDRAEDATSGASACAPLWDEGSHLCPKCKKYGFEFGLTISFSD